MLQNRKIIHKIVYSLVGFVGLCCAAWMTFDLKRVSNEAIDQPQIKVIQQAISPVKNSVEGAAGSIANTDSSHCSTQCSLTLSMLNEDLVLDDEAFQRLRTYAEEIAAYLRTNESQLQHYLQMALTTSDGDRRAFLTDIFQHLPYQTKTKIAENYIDSENWRVRADGVTLFADHGIAKSNLVNSRLMKLFSREENSYVKNSILSHLQHSSILQGDSEILHQLDSAIYNETNPSVRVAAFKAKNQLLKHPYQILPDALQGLRTNEPEFQFASLIAIERLLARQEKYSETDVYIDSNSIKDELQLIRNLKLYGDKKRSDRLIKQANAIYLRYFNS